MRQRHALIVAVSALLVAGCGTTAIAPFAERAGAGESGARARANEVVVSFKSARARQTLPGTLGLRTVETIPQLGVVIYRAAGDAKEAVAALRRDPGVRMAELNGVEKVQPVRAGRPPRIGFMQFDDPLMKDQWALAKVEAPAAWQVTTGKKETVLAIVDTGVDYKHPDLAGRVLKGYDFTNGDDDAMDGHSHGTHCAGIAAATAGNQEGIAGLAPGVSILPVKVLSDSGYGSTTDVVKGIVWAVDNGAKVVSLSLGGASNPELKQQAVDYALSKDVLVVAAMGNNGGEIAVYPGANKGAMGVGATTAEDARASFSNYGDWISVSAPGHNILSTIPGAKYKAYSGTSMATPYVAGLAALVRSQHPDWDHLKVKAHIEKTADDIGDKGFDKQFGHGRINAAAALR